MSVLVNTLAATFAVSLASLIGMFALSLNHETLHRVLFVLIAFSAGSILGASLFDLLPEAVELVEGSEVFMIIAFGFVAFFVLERLIYWYHGHGHSEDIGREGGGATRGFAYLNLVGDFIHNTIDGMIIAASFLEGLQLGLATTIAVAFHELPQEIGDYGILVYAGFERRRALLTNFVAATAVVLGGLLALAFIETAHGLSGWLIAFSAGSFLYLSASELVPEMHEERGFARSAVQLLIFLVGLATIWSLGFLFVE